MLDRMRGRVRARFFKKPRTILNACIRDIDRGLWMCGELADHCDTKKEEPMGCALGLIGINSGAGTLDESGRFYNLAYPFDGLGEVDEEEDFKPWSKEAHQAIIALAQAVPREWWKSRYHKTKFKIKDGPHAADVIIAYNDGELGTQEDVGRIKPDTAAAREWFQRAVDAL